MPLDISRRRVLAYTSLITTGAAGCVGGPITDEDEDDSASTSDGGEGEADHDQSDDEHADDGHSDEHEHADDHDLGDPASMAEVRLETDDGFHFVPHVVHVEVGGTVEWVLESGSHDVTAYHPDTHGNQLRIPEEAEPWKSELLSDEGDTFERTFDVKGVYDYACTPHEANGMVGTVLVGWPDSEEQPGLQSPDGDYPDAAVDQLERYNEQVREALEAGDDGSNNDEEDGHDHGDHEH